MQQMFMTYVIFAETFENIIHSALNVKLFIYKAREFADFFDKQSIILLY